jgi:peptidyl-prolyl cis-trans isomerase D
LFQYPAVVTAAFSDEVLIDGHNSEVIEVAENHFVTVRLKEHYPAQALPLADVRIEIINAIISDGAAAAAEAMADSLLAKLHAGSSVEEVALAAGYEWQVEIGLLPESGALPEAGMRRVFQLPTISDASQFDYVTIPGGDILLFELYRATTGTVDNMPPQRAEQLSQRVAGELGGQIDEQYLGALREQADIDIL